MIPPGLIIAAPASGSGKTTVTLGLLAALRARGLAVQPFKSGPDYIDPAFHRAAAGRASLNLDSWAMAPGRIAALVQAARGADLILAEGSMGLFDGVARLGESGTGASADLAALLGWPVVLVLDVSGQAQSAAAVARGFAMMRAGVTLAGVVLNRIASPRHEALVRAGMAEAGVAVFGALPRAPAITLPERHLGLVQANETPDLARLLADLGVTSASDEMLPAFSSRMLEGIKMLDGAIPMIRHHKERFDGTGYPGKLKGEDIPLGGRILGLVVKMEELRSAGLKDAALGTQALKEAQAGSGTSYDPKVVEAFAAVLESQGGIW